MPSTRPLFSSSCLLLALAVGGPLGCQSDRPHSAAPPSARHADSMATPAAMSDGEFAAMMGKHHESAIEMARYEAKNGTRPEVREIARKMADAQSAENTKLEPIAREGGHADHKSDPMMEKHLMQDMQELKAARGAEVDRLFLVHMTDHHAQGVDMTRRSLPNLKRDDLRRMAQQMIDDQTREIAQMRGMLGR